MTPRSIRFVRLGAALILGLATVASVAAQVEWRHVHGGAYGGAFFLDDMRGWLTADAHIKYTTDGGYTWSEAEIPDAVFTEDIRVQLRGMFIVEKSPLDIWGLAVGDNGVVLETVSGSLGKEWRDRNPNSRVLDACLLEPATLYDIYMFEDTDYMTGWCVGTQGAIATTSDGGETWVNVATNVNPLFVCDSGTSGPADDAYVVHFFENDPTKGIIAGEYGMVFTTTTGGLTAGSWTAIDVVEDPLEAECPLGPSGHLNLEWWGLDFEDPADPASPGVLVGGVGNVKGYMYRTSGMDVSESWVGTWEQLKDYQFLDPAGVSSMSCAPTTQYGVVVLDPDPDPLISPVALTLSVGYGSELFAFKPGFPNYDPCNACEEIINPIPDDSTWVEQPRPLLSDGNGEPLFRDIAKLSPTLAVAAGGFGRIVRYDAVMGTVSDHGSLIPRRLNDGVFFDSMKGVVVGQHLDVHYTEDGRVHWTPAETDEQVWFHDGGYQGYAIAFDSTGDHGLAVGDQLGEPFAYPFVGKGFMARTVGSPGSAYTDWELVNLDHNSPQDLNDVTFVAGSTCDGAPMPETAYAVGQGAWILKSDDLGASWTHLQPPGPTTQVFECVSFATPCKGYIGGEIPYVYATENGGGSWQTLNLPSPDPVFDIETWGDGSNAIAVGRNGGVWVKTSSRFLKVNWQDHNLVVDENLMDVEFIEATNEVWVCGDRGGLLYRDSAGSWSKHPSGTSEPLVKVAFPAPGVGFAVGITFTALRSQ